MLKRKNARLDSRRLFTTGEKSATTRTRELSSGAHMNLQSLHPATTILRWLACSAFVLSWLTSACSDKRALQNIAVTETSKNPLPDLAAAAAAGKPLYAANCAACHGDSGKGDGIAGDALSAKTTDLTTDAIQSTPDGGIFLVIKNGKTTNGKIVMPPVRRLNDEQIWQMTAYVRTLGRK
jgi:mono/diheme cytochrome c family protein